MLSSFVLVGFGTIYVMSYFNLAGGIIFTGAFAAPVRYFIIFFDMCVRLKEGNYLLPDNTCSFRAIVFFPGTGAFPSCFMLLPVIVPKNVMRKKHNILYHPLDFTTT